MKTAIQSLTLKVTTRARLNMKESLSSGINLHQKDDFNKSIFNKYLSNDVIRKISYHALKKALVFSFIFFFRETFSPPAKQHNYGNRRSTGSI